MQRKKVIIYLYNRFNDPLIQSNLWLYIDKIAETDKYKFTLVTYENTATLDHEEKDYRLKNDEIQKIISKLGEKNIDWIRLDWFSGKSIYNKFKCFNAGFKKIRELKKQGYENIIALGTVAGSFAYIFSKVLRLNLYLYQYEPHSEYSLDTGYWTKSSLGYRLLNYLERKSAFNAKVISSGTRHMEERLKGWKTKASFYKIPSVVNQDKFIYSKANANYIKEKYNIPLNKKVILYAGKFDGLYFNEENPQMFSYLRSFNNEFHILIVTLNPLEEIKSLFAKYGLTENITITSSTYGDIDKYLSAANFGIVSVESGPSKKFVSNIKVGEYLSTGLPYLICKGISEDDWYAEHRDVGVVVKDFSKEEIEKAYPKIEAYLNMPPAQLKTHCREVGVEYRRFKNLYPIFQKAIEKLIS